MAARDEAQGRSARHDPPAALPPNGDLSWIDDVDPAVRAPLTLHQRATGQNVTDMRRTFATWLELDVAAGELVDDVVLAVYEALANVAEHAYVDTADVGMIGLTAHRAHMSLRITVADQGHWRPDKGSPFRGRGLSVIRLLIPQVHIDATASGTVMHLQCALPLPLPAPEGVGKVGGAGMPGKHA